MLIIGAKGFAKEVLEVCHQNNELENLSFYDDVNDDVFGKLYNQFPILKSIEEARYYFENIDNRFTIGIGNPLLRRKLYEKFSSLGGILTSTFSNNAIIGSFDISIGSGTNILSGVQISNSVKIGFASIVYYNSIITHDCVLGDFVEVSPAVKILGRVNVGNETQLGAGSCILPDIKLGNNVIIGAGSVVTKDIPDNCTAVGIPAKVIKQN